MRIPYRILWIDDRIKDEVERTEKIASYLSGLGFSPEIEEIEDVEEFEKTEKLSELVKRVNFDLILTDFNLGEDSVTGRYVVKELRDGNILTEILFYTSQPNLIDIVKPLYFGDGNEDERLFQPVQRISFHPGQGGLVDKIKEILDLNVSKFQEIRAFRGFVLAETSDLDSVIEKIGNKLVENVEKDALKKRFQKSLRGTQKFLDTTNKKFEGLFNAEDYNGYLLETNASNRYELIKELVKLYLPVSPVPDFDLDLFSRYIEVIRERNCFAHDCLIETDDGKVYLKKTNSNKTSEYNQERCIALRNKIRDHSTNIQVLANTLAIEFNEV